MTLTIPQCEAIYKLYPSVICMRGDTPFDADGNEVAYDINAVNFKVTEMQSEEEAKTQAAQDKLAALGLTPEDLRRILG